MLILITLLLLTSGAAMAADDEYPAAERVVAVGDVHGDFEAFVTILRSAGVIDKKNKWTGGKTTLVQTGDVLDRGADSRKAMDLLIALEKQSAKSGGRVLALIGNHEAMNIYGDLRYTVAGEFAAFRTDDSPRVRDLFWQEEVKRAPSPPDEGAKKRWESEHPLGWFEHRLAFGPQGDYGKWIRSHNAIVKVGDTLFMHGGISPKYVSTPSAVMNQAIRDLLTDFSRIKDGDIVTGEDSPMWYRGLATGAESDLTAHVAQVLTTFGVKRIVIGHTPTNGAIVPRFGGKVILIDVAMSAYFGRKGSASLVIEGGKAAALDRGTRKPID